MRSSAPAVGEQPGFGGMLLSGERAACLMTDAPSDVDASQLAELGLSLSKKKNSDRL